MKKLYYKQKDMFGYMSHEDYNQLKNGTISSCLLQCGITSYSVTINEISSDQ